ncbi:hypothetical protein L226DRAFT_32808 [Lentinus tigrinus ALCF2SS1-7]|uniref:uncharacterized protein n=1 Tax=Lentinus tigrinus ALCF2SS1-7 TaxID=1328758 RepID=UPI0011661665|nr:hypothetical protein L226DRAFT_32808 [Lentinus tigrinus ALCF2SS1-7]
MWIHPKPVFNATSTAAALAARATSTPSSSSSSHQHGCPTIYPSCNLTGPGPALADISAEASANSALPGTLTPTPQAALATGIQHFGKRNFIGLLVLGLLALAGLVLWITFGAWPQRMIRRLRARAGGAKSEREPGPDGKLEGRRGADLDREAASPTEGAGTRAHPHEPHPHEPHPHEPSESEDKVQSESEEGAPGSPHSLEMEVEGLEKGTDEAAEEAKRRTLPRVRFA